MMNNANFAKGMGVGLMVGSALGLACSSAASKKPSKHSMVGKALKTMGDLVENVSDAIGM